MLDLEEMAPFKRVFDDRYRRRTLRGHLRRVDAFSALGDDVIDRLARHAELVTFKPGREIAKEGTPADGLLLVRGGYVKVSVRIGDADRAATYLRKGDWAGETALLLDEPWPFTLTAVEHVELVKLPRPVVDRLRSSIPELEGALWRTLTARLKHVGAARREPRRSDTLQFAMDSGLIHGESVLLIDLNLCTRCDDCVRACADAHDGTPRFVREGAKFRHFGVPSACYHCSDPVCMIGCPTGAITRPLGTLEVAIDRNTCIGCGNCVRRCPWDNIRAVPYDSPTVGGPIQVATKCDLCVGRAAGPACVQMCPHGAAVRVDFKDDARVRQILDRP
jgi:Fe-S-cluster-containing hydrogenase component 2/CRP-like cAMP-binding protein